MAKMRTRLRPASVTGVHDLDEYDYASRAPAPQAQMLFTSEARSVEASLKKELVPRAKKTVFNSSFQGENAGKKKEDQKDTDESQEARVSLPAITRLLKPKDMDLKRRQRKKNKEGQERAKSVDLHAEDLVDEAEQRLKRELSQFGSSARSAGFIVNTGKLWRQSGFCPPDKHCMQIKERKASFVEWKESAQLEFQKTQLLQTSESSALGEREDPMMSPRDMTEAQAERMLKVLQKNMLKLAKESNECKDHRRRAEKNLNSLKAESVTAAGLRMQGLKDEGARLAAAKGQDLQQLAEVEASIKEREKERRGMETLHQRLKNLVSQDDKTLAAMQDELKKFTLDLECLRAKVKHELPVVQKSLLANDLHATKLVIQSIREHYSKELEAKRQAVRDAAALRLEMLEADQRKKEIEEELRQMYDPAINSPRRNELKRKLQVYEETLETMMKKLGDVSVDRITTLFTQMKHSKSTWDDAVRDAEARCEELRREHNVLHEALKSVYEREEAPVGDVLRRIHEVKDKFELKNDKAAESERKLTQIYQLMALVRSGLLSALKRIAKVAGGNVSVSLERLASSVNMDDDEEEADVDSLDVVLPTLVTQYKEMTNKILDEVKTEAALNDSQALRNFKGFAPLKLVSTSSTPQHPVLISIDPGRPESLGIKAASDIHASGIAAHAAASAHRPAPKADDPPAQASPCPAAAAPSPEAGAAESDDSRADGQEAPATSAPEHEDGAEHQGEGADEESKVAGVDGEEQASIDVSGYENDSFETLETLEAEQTLSSLGSPVSKDPSKLDKALRPPPRAPPIDGVQDLGLFAGPDIREAVASITFPRMELQRRVKFPKKMRRRDKRKGVQYCSDSDTQHSTGSETSFDYDEIEEELAIDIYAEREAAKRRAAKLTHSRGKKPAE